MRWYWKVLIGLCSFVLLVVVVNVGINLWIKFQLPKIINNDADSAYVISFKKLKVSLLERNIFASEVMIVPRASLSGEANKSGVHTRVHTIEVKDFKLWNVLFSDKLKARSITFEQPKSIYYKNDVKTDLRKSAVVAFEKIITVSDVFLRKGDLKMIDVKNDEVLLSVKNISLDLDGILINERILNEKIPFEFEDYKMSCDSIYYHPNPFYNIRIQKVTATKTALDMEHLKVLPKFSRRVFTASIPTEKDMYTLLCKSVAVSQINWGFKEDDFFFHCDAVAVNHAAANVYRSKVPSDNTEKRYLYSKLLRDLEFDLKVDTLKVRNSIVEYEEQKSSKTGVGKLSFGNFKLTATDIRSGFKKEKKPDLKIKIQCRFMNTSPLHVNWSFNVMDKSDTFRIAGKLTNFNTAEIVSFTKPYMNLETSGMLDEVNFNFTGNDKRNSGKFSLKYDDLKFTIFRKKNPEKKNKFLTFLAKIFVKKNTKGRVKEAYVEVERIPEKSFYNLLWRSAEKGLKEIIM